MPPVGLAEPARHGPGGQDRKEAQAATHGWMEQERPLGRGLRAVARSRPGRLLSQANAALEHPEAGFSRVLNP